MVAVSFKKYLFLGFLALIAVVAAIAFSAPQALLSVLPWLLALAVIGILFTRVENVLLKLLDYERAVLFRFGKINRVGGPGWALRIPFIETYAQVDLRTQTLDVAQQQVITRGNIELTIDAVLYLRVRSDRDSVIRSVVQVEDYKQASIIYVVSSIRNLVGGMYLHEVISGIDILNDRLTRELEEITDKWGIHVESVEIKDVNIPETVLASMHAAKSAEQEKLARLERALGVKGEIDATREAADELGDRALQYYYLKALESMGQGKSTKVLVPMELTNLAATLGAAIPSGKIDKTQLPKLVEKAVAGEFKARAQEKKKASLK